MTGTPGDVTSVRTVGNELINAQAAGAPAASTLAQLAAALPPGQHDLETLALWLAMAREAGVELQPGEEPIDTQDGGRHWRFTVPRVTLDGAHLAHMDWEL